MRHLRRRVVSIKNFLASAWLIWLASAKRFQVVGDRPEQLAHLVRHQLDAIAVDGVVLPVVDRMHLPLVVLFAAVRQGHSVFGEMKRRIDETFGQP